jgi:hypothetical protein
MRHSVIYDPDAVVELLAMKSKEEHRALLNAVRKLIERAQARTKRYDRPLSSDKP